MVNMFNYFWKGACITLVAVGVLNSIDNVVDKYFAAREKEFDKMLDAMKDYVFED